MYNFYFKRNIINTLVIFTIPGMSVFTYIASNKINIQYPQRYQASAKLLREIESRGNRQVGDYETTMSSFKLNVTSFILF